jgi:uncharacterized protein (DUF4415 family)
MENTELFQPEGPEKMKKKRTKNIVSHHAHHLPIDTKTDWKRVDAMTEQELKRNARSDQATILANKKFWDSAKLVIPENSNKERITIRVDADILDWLKEDGRGYQTRINTILRSCMNALKKPSS